MVTRHLKTQAGAEAKAQADLDKAAAGDGEEKE
jgi:hypothetical protein